MRMTASWSGSNDPTAYKSVTRRSVPNGELPSDPQQTDRQAPTRHRNYAKSPSCNSSSRSEPDRRRRDEERLYRSEQKSSTVCSSLPADRRVRRISVGGLP